ncbi:tetratricopeptide repeat-containing sensor histidine kinase [Niabella soli]|uniref:tetratricopeptide repeat-containing sensor histidine kinase n=1 Tax=Niabella soli TaxID=446683 RepID=UPI001FDEBE9C|nr:tetratricopeptide repeat-containing sensor histidine kinase [Niabella soli]
MNNDSAFYYFNKVLAGSRDSLQVAKAYTYMAIIQSDAGDHFGSQESLLQSLKLLNEKRERDQGLLVSNYNELGYTSADLNNQSAAIGYYDLALKFARDDSFKVVILNNKALAYQKKKQYDQALMIFRSAIDKSTHYKKEYARILSNIANTKWLKDTNYNATAELLMALQIRENEKDGRGLNASYAHLSNYYTHTHSDSALIYAGKMYALAQQRSSPDDELEALQKLITLSPPEAIKKYFIRYWHLNDSLQTSRNNAKNQFALIRYEAAKTKADNLALQKDNTEKKIQILVQRGVLSGTIVFTILIFFWYRRRKQRMIRNQQLKTSQKVHDEVANGIYRIMSEIEHTEFLQKEPLLDKLDVVYERSRNISYEPSENIHPDFQQSITELLESFASETTRVLIVGNAKEIWNGLPPKTKTELEHIFQELMINMKRHSAAENVVVKFERSTNLIKINYSDDGAGLPPDFHYGNGLNSTENRMKVIKGRIIFDKTTTEGLKIQLYIPIV